MIFRAVKNTMPKKKFFNQEETMKRIKFNSLSSVCQCLALFMLVGTEYEFEVIYVQEIQNLGY